MQKGKIWVCIFIVLAVLANTMTVSHAATIIGITVELADGVKVRQYDTIEPSDLKVKTVYSDSTTGTVSSSRIDFVDENLELYRYNEFTIDSLGVNTLIVKYNNYYAVLTISVDETADGDEFYINKTLYALHAEYVGPKVSAGGSVKRSDVNVYAIYTIKYEDEDKDVVTRRITEKLSSGWTMGSYSIGSGSNTIKITYKEDGKTVSANIQVESTDTSGEWILEGGFWRYIHEDGTYLCGDWVKTGGVWYYLDDQGYMVKDTVMTIGNQAYRFNPSGAMQTGWVKVQGEWYYYADSGELKTGWVKSGGKWYYLNDKGIMQTGWLCVKDVWYYMNEGTGAMHTGWLHKGVWYYMDPVNGNMRTGWVKTNGKWYYLDIGGGMVTNTWVGNYYVDGNGAWTQTR